MGRKVTEMTTNKRMEYMERHISDYKMTCPKSEMMCKSPISCCRADYCIATNRPLFEEKKGYAISKIPFINNNHCLTYGE